MLWDNRETLAVQPLWPLKTKDSFYGTFFWRQVQNGVHCSLTFWTDLNISWSFVITLWKWRRTGAPLSLDYLYILSQSWRIHTKTLRQTNPFSFCTLWALLDITIRPPKQFRRVLVCFAHNKLVKHILHTESNSLKLITFLVCQSLVRSGPLSRW